MARRSAGDPAILALAAFWGDIVCGRSAGLARWKNVGPAIITLGPAVEALEKIATLVNLDLNGFYPSDFAVEEFGHSVGFLDAFLLQQIPAHRFVPAFVVRPSAGTGPSPACNGTRPSGTTDCPEP